eukprot:4663751-Pyramimonas_sp.AAC.1
MMLRVLTATSRGRNRQRRQTSFVAHRRSRRRRSLQPRLSQPRAYCIKTGERIVVPPIDIFAAGF